MEFIIQLLLILLALLLQFTIVLGPFYVIGRIVEGRHYKSIREREKALISFPAINIKSIETDRKIAKTQLVTGSAVISLDHFKRFLAMLRNIFGGRVGAFESLLDRARREAILRMKESCKDADYILNLRIETSSIGKSANQKKTIGAVEALAYGTAVTLEKSSLEELR